MKLFCLTLLVSLTAFADPTETRLQEISLIANSLVRETMFNSIEFTTGLEQFTPAASFFLGNGHYQIAINKDIFDTLPSDAQDFVRFHELGHIYLGHTEMDPAKKNRYEIELEADAFASFMYKRFGNLSPTFENFLSFIEQQEGTTPPGDVRGKLIRQIISGN